MHFKLEVCGNIEEIGDVVRAIEHLKGLNDKHPIETALEPLVEAIGDLAYSNEEVAAVWRGEPEVADEDSAIVVPKEAGELSRQGELVD